MKGSDTILGYLNDREAMARFEDGKLVDLIVDSDAPRPGTIYRARALRPVKGMGGVFVSTPDGNAFLRQGKGISPGDDLLVQVTGYAEPGKAFPVTTRLLFKSRYAIVTPHAPGLNISRAIRDDDIRDTLHVIAKEEMAGSDMGLILRTSASVADPDHVAEDIRAMLELAHRVLEDDGTSSEKLLEGDGPHDLGWREARAEDRFVDTNNAFEAHGVLEALQELAQPRVPLPGGAFFYVEPTRALVSVDVNTGSDMSPASGLKANLACAQDLARQLRLRGLGGQITIDFAPMPRKDRRALENALTSAFRKDTEETTLAGWTPLGNFELQRKRGRIPLHEVMT